MEWMTDKQIDITMVTEHMYLNLQREIKKLYTWFSRETPTPKRGRETRP